MQFVQNKSHINTINKKYINKKCFVFIVLFKML